MPFTYHDVKRFLNNFSVSSQKIMPEGRTAFWSFLCLLTFITCMIAEYMINAASMELGQRMIVSMQSRAESLIWALEAGVRFFRQKQSEPLQELLSEMSRQPGIAWIAITNSQGRILYDSDPGLGGEQLYTAYELTQLNPGGRIQGRFAPDEALYECWKLFRPERLGKNKRGFGRGDKYYIFIALNSYYFQEDINKYMEKSRLVATLFCAAISGFLVLLFYIYNFRLSRRKLVMAEALAMEVIENYPGGLLLTDLKGKIILANDKVEGFLHQDVKPGTFLEKSYDWQSCIDELNLKNSILEREINIPWPDSSPRSISLSAILISGENEKQGLFIFRDLSEIRRLRKKLSQSRRFSAIGKIAAGVAHEIRNPLSSIRGYAHYLRNRLEGDPLGKATSDLLVDETRRINNVLTDLLSLSRTPKLNLNSNSLVKILSKAAMLIQPDIANKEIELKLSLQEREDEDWPLTDEDRLLQAILNLLINAVQFTPSGGKIVLGLRRAERSGECPDGWLIIVEDNGAGIGENALSQIFNPYYTSRKDGTGLGLSISRQIVESHGGEILVSSVPGRGSIFTIFLPDPAYQI